MIFQNNTNFINRNLTSYFFSFIHLRFSVFLSLKVSDFLKKQVFFHDFHQFYIIKYLFLETTGAIYRQYTYTCVSNISVCILVFAGGICVHFRYRECRG